MIRSKLSSVVPVALVAAAWGCGSSDVEPDPGAVSGASAVVEGGAIVVEGNPTCVDLQIGTIEIKSDPPTSETFDLGYGEWIKVTTDGMSLDWESSIGIDALIVKGGDNANVYEYDPEAYSGSGLTSPINPNNGTPYAISHYSICYDWEVKVEKTAETSYKRTYDWSIDKTGAKSSLVMMSGQTYVMGYDVTASVSGYTDSDWAVEGEIKVTNPAPHDATVVAVSDMLDGMSIPVSCPPLPVVLAPGESIVCTYESALGSDATLKNFAYAETSGLVGDGEGSATVDFAAAAEHAVDACVDVDDDKYGVLGTLCASESPYVFSYSMNIGPYEVCGPALFENTACLQEKDSGEKSCDTWPVSIEVTDCSSGCSLTPGYWKTHSAEGPAPYDDNWQNVGPAEEDTSFYLSGASYYDVLWAAPKGNVYYILAHAYIAAYLNQLNGADTSAVSDELAEAKAIFESYSPADLDGVRGKLRVEITSLASTLDDYNNGLIGPGHCDQ